MAQKFGEAFGHIRIISFFSTPSSDHIVGDLSSKPLSKLKILLSELVLVRLFAPVQWRPLGLVLEQAHSLCVLQTNISIDIRINARDHAVSKPQQIWAKLTFCSSVVKRW